MIISVFGCQPELPPPHCEALQTCVFSDVMCKFELALASCLCLLLGALARNFCEFCCVSVNLLSCTECSFVFLLFFEVSAVGQLKSLRAGL